MDYLTFRSGVPRRVLGTEYTLRGLVKLFMHFQIFDKLDTLSRTQYWSEKSARAAQRMAEEAGQVFYMPLKEDDHLSKQALDDIKFRQIETMARSNKYVKFDDRRKK
jgi:hypothetical protein